MTKMGKIVLPDGACCGWRIHATRNKHDVLSFRYFAKMCDELHAGQLASKQPDQQPETVLDKEPEQEEETDMAKKKATTKTAKTAKAKAKAKAKPKTASKINGAEAKPSTKVCNTCERRLSVDRFGKYSRSADGLRGFCKECASERRAARSE